MTITRNGTEIELTEEELYAAYCEQQAKFDREDVAELLDAYDDVNFHEIFEIHKEDFIPLLSEVAKARREIVDAHGDFWRDWSFWWDSFEDAAHAVIQRHKGGAKK